GFTLLQVRVPGPIWPRVSSTLVGCRFSLSITVPVAQLVLPIAPSPVLRALGGALGIQLSQEVIKLLAAALGGVLELGGLFRAPFNPGVLVVELLEVALVRLRGLRHLGHVGSHPGLVLLNHLQRLFFPPD